VEAYLTTIVVRRVVFMKIVGLGKIALHSPPHSKTVSFRDKSEQERQL